MSVVIKGDSNKLGDVRQVRTLSTSSSTSTSAEDNAAEDSAAGRDPDSSDVVDLK